jgi:hypothetical protein
VLAALSRSAEQTFIFGGGGIIGTLLVQAANAARAAPIAVGAGIALGFAGTGIVGRRRIAHQQQHGQQDQEDKQTVGSHQDARFCPKIQYISSLDCLWLL